MAAREIKTTIAVDGEAAFKRDINDAKTSIRNLGTQLTLAAAEFKKDGDAMKLMQSRAKALKDEITAQKNIVKALEGAVRDANEKYGEGSKEAGKWEAELNRAKATMLSLESELNNNNRGLDKNGKAFDSAKEKAGAFSGAVNDIAKGVSFQAITSGIDKISSGFETAIRKATQLATKMWDMMRDAAQWADDKVTLASVYGMDTDELQRFEWAAKRADVDVDTVIKSRQKLEKAMASGSADTVAAFQAVRTPTVDNNTGKYRNVDDVFWEAGLGLSQIEDEVERDNAAMKLFGKSWMELRPLFDYGRESFTNAYNETNIIPAENLEKLVSLNDELDRMDQEIQNLKINGLASLAPSFEVLAGGIADLMAQFNEYLASDEGKAMMEELNDAIKSLFSGLKDVDFQSAVDTVKGGLKGIQDAFSWISEHAGDIQNALLIIAGAMAAMKIGQFALGVGQAVAGFRGLMHLGGGRTPTGTPGTTPTETAAPAPATRAAGNAFGKNMYIRTQDMTRKIIANTNGFNLNNGAAVGDWFTHNTAIGRQLTNGIYELFGQDAPFVKENLLDTYWENGIKKNAIDWWGNTQALYGQVYQFWKNHFAGQIPEESSGSTYEVKDLFTEGTPIDSGVSPSLYYSIPSGSGHSYTTDKEGSDALKNLPGETGNAVRRSVSGMKVEMDGRTVGRLVAPYVSEYIAYEAQ